MGKGALIIVAAAVLSGGILLNQANKMAASADANQSGYEVEVIVRDIARSGMSFVAAEALEYEDEGMEKAAAAVNGRMATYQSGTYRAKAHVDPAEEMLTLEVTGERAWQGEPVRHTVRRYYAPEFEYSGGDPEESVGDGDEGDDFSDIDWNAEYVLTVLGDIEGMHVKSGKKEANTDRGVVGGDIKAMGVLPSSYDGIADFDVNDAIFTEGNGEALKGNSIYALDADAHTRLAEALYALATAEARSGTEISDAPADDSKSKGKGKNKGSESDSGREVSYVRSGDLLPFDGCAQSEVRYMTHSAGRYDLSGCGVLVVDGNLDFAAGNNSLHWKGIVLAQNDEHVSMDLRGQGKETRIEGKVVLLTGDGDDHGSVDIALRGNNTIRYSETAFIHALELLGITKSGWVEIGSSDISGSGSE